MEEIFVSFRVNDEAFGAMLIQRELGDALGRERIFRSSDCIKPGDDYVRCITDAVRRCQVVVVVMGRNWLALDDHGRSRLDDAADWVYREVALAFAHGKRVFPVLLGAAKMPKETDLPHSIARLSRCQYRRLDHRQFSVNMGLIVADLRNMLGGSAEENLAPAALDSWAALDGAGPTTWAGMQPNHRQHP
jgi:hypothetical protein